MKPPLTKRPSKVGYRKLNEMPGTSKCLRQKYQFLNSLGKTIWRNYGKRAKSKWGMRISNRWNHIRKKGLLLMVKIREFWNLKPKLWTSQIWSLIKNFVIVLASAKCSKLTLEENIISVQQLLLCLPLFFTLSSEVLNSGVKSCFDGVVFQDSVCEECFSIRLRCLHL